MRQAARLAAQHAAGRKAFGSALIDQPLMRGVLGDLGLETEAANATWRALCAAADGGDAAWTRLATPVAKYWLCKRAPLVAAEAMECFGGNGYDEKFPMARLYPRPRRSLASRTTCPRGISTSAAAASARPASMDTPRTISQVQTGALERALGGFWQRDRA